MNSQTTFHPIQRSSHTGSHQYTPPWIKLPYKSDEALGYARYTCEQVAHGGLTPLSTSCLLLYQQEASIAHSTN